MLARGACPALGAPLLDMIIGVLMHDNCWTYLRSRITSFRLLLINRQYTALHILPCTICLQSQSLEDQGA